MKVITAGQEPLLVRLARDDVNHPAFGGFPLAAQVADVRFESAVYKLLDGAAEVHAARLLHSRCPRPSKKDDSSTSSELYGRRLFVFQHAEGEAEVWHELPELGKVTLGDLTIGL